MTTRARAFQHFKSADKRFHKAVAGHIRALPEELPAKRTRVELFAELASTVISQQLGGAAADAIRAKVKRA